PRATERGRRWRCRNRTPSSPVHGGGRRRRRRGPVTPLHLVNPRVLLATPRPAQGPPETRPTARPALRRASAAAPACGGRVARDCAQPRDGLSGRSTDAVSSPRSAPTCCYGSATFLPHPARLEL